MNLELPSLRRVLCALDVEGSSWGALSVASLIAERFRASVDALYAPAPVLSLSGREERVRRLIAEHNARERLQGLLGPMSSLLDVTSYVTRGRPSDVILAHSEAHASDLIVMGASGSARFGDTRSGTVAPVSTGASCAVLSVHPQETERSVRRILLPVGDAFADEPATSWAIALATRFSAEVDVLPVRPAGCGFWQVFSSQSRSKSALASADGRVRARSHAALSRLRSARIGVREIEHLEHSSFDAITALAESGAFDVVIMGLHAHGNGVLGGEDLVATLRRRTGVSVLSVRATPANSLFSRSDLRTARTSSLSECSASA